MINNINQLIDNNIVFTEKDTIHIITEAFKIITAEKEYNFNLEHHKNNLSNTARTKGCGCYYCKLRYELRTLKQKKAEFKRNFILTNLNQKIFEQRLIQLDKEIKETKEKKHLIKLKLNLI